MKFIYNRNFLLTLLILNFVGIILAFYTYIPHINRYFILDKFYVIPFFAVSFWLYLFSFLIIFYLYTGKKIPSILGILAFVYMFVYGFGSVVFYPLFMLFVKGFSFYHFWNVFAHAYVGLQALLFYKFVNAENRFHVFSVAGVFIVKDFFDLFRGGFLYFIDFNFPIFLKIFLIALILILQILAFYLLIRNNPKRLK